MFKTILMSVAVLATFANVSTAQLSPAATASVTIGGKSLSIRYSAPSVRGRQIFGDNGVVSRDPTYPAWRAGANEATSFHTDADLDLGGLRVPKGSYTLFVWVKDPNAWELIVNKETGQWGLSHNVSQDLGRVKMTMSKPPSTVERLKYTLTDKGAGQAELRLEWEAHIATVPITLK